MTKNVVIITPGFAAGEHDTTCIPFLQMFVNEFKNLPNVRLQIITLQYPFESKTYWYNGVKVHALGGGNKKGLQRFLNWLSTYRLLKKLHRQNRTDAEPGRYIDAILSCWATESAFVGSYFAKFNSIKHICWIIGQDSKADNRYVKYLGKNTVFVSKTPFIKSFFEKNHGLMPAHIIPSGLNLSKLPQLKIENKKIDFIGVGSLISLKRFEWFVQMARDLTQKGFDITCVLIGAGAEKASLEKKIDGYNLANSFKLLGNKPHGEVLEQLAQSKILIHPSFFEGLSTVTLEALYAGCHVISYCRPFEEHNEQVHYIDTYGELLKKAEELISDKKLVHESQKNYSTQKSAEAFARLISE